MSEHEEIAHAQYDVVAGVLPGALGKCDRACQSARPELNLISVLVLVHTVPTLGQQLTLTRRFGYITSQPLLRLQDCFYSRSPSTKSESE